ncbi:MAG: DUF5005 domain-containing protein [Bacteroidales bacterium]
MKKTIREILHQELNRESYKRLKTKKTIPACAGIIQILILLLLLSSCNRDSRVTVSTDRGYDSLFSRSSGWTGGDIATSVALGDSVTLWLFGDSWIGNIKDGRHFYATMINNAVGLQYHDNRGYDSMAFFYKTIEGKPGPIFTPPGDSGFLWLTGGGIRIDNKLFLVAGHIVKLQNDTTVFGFEQTGNYLIEITNPDDDPTKWNYSMKRIPFFNRTGGIEREFGSIQFAEGNFVYIYGTEFDRNTNNRYMLLSRVTKPDLSDPGKWMFYTPVGWDNDYTKAARLCDRFGAEYSVSFCNTVNKYITVYSELGMSDKIIMRSSPKSEGPWSGQQIIFITPDMKRDSTYFCYAAKAHPDISGENDLLVSYICNSFDFWKMASDTAIYRPRFIRVKFH